MIGSLFAISVSFFSPMGNQGLLADFRILKEAYTKLHPGLYRYNTPKEMEANFEALRKAFGRSSSIKQAYRDLSEFTAKVKCGHTYPNFFNQRKSIVAAVFSGKNRVPFHFRWLGEKMIVTRDLSGKRQFPKGTEILSINEISTRQILATLMKVARADGSNDAKRKSLLEVQGIDRYEAFDIYFPLYFPSKNKVLNFRTRSLAGAKTNVASQALSMEDRTKEFEESHKPKSPSGDLWTFKILPNKIGYLQMDSWAMYDEKWDWSKFLKTSFEQLSESKATGLIIDLRGNEGGNSVGETILSYLTTQPLKLKQFDRYTRYERAPQNLKPYLDTWDRSFDDWSKWTSPQQYLAQGKNRFFRMKRWDEEGGDVAIKPASPHFGGKVVVLMDSSNSSATFEFNQMAQRLKLATLIGQPSGGNQRGINGSAFYFLRLPNSGLEVDLPLVGAFSPTPMPDAGLTPDVFVQDTVADIANGRDPVMAAGLRFLETRLRKSDRN